MSLRDALRIPASQITDESVYRDRRRLLQAGDVVVAVVQQVRAVLARRGQGLVGPLGRVGEGALGQAQAPGQVAAHLARARHRLERMRQFGEQLLLLRTDEQQVVGMHRGAGGQRRAQAQRHGVDPGHGGGAVGELALDQAGQQHADDADGRAIDMLAGGKPALHVARVGEHQ